MILMWLNGRKIEMEDRILPWLAMFPITLAIVGSQAPNGGTGYWTAIFLVTWFILAGLWGASKIIKDMFS